MSDGGHAFPFPGWRHPTNNEWKIYPDLGMSLRDYFAAQAMGGLVRTVDDMDFGTYGAPKNPWVWRAEQAYLAADAMLKARKEAT